MTEKEKKVIRTKLLLQLPLTRKEQAIYLLFLATNEEIKNYKGENYGI